jgi:hypothetical protein
VVERLEDELEVIKPTFKHWQPQAEVTVESNFKFDHLQIVTVTRV